MEDLPRAHAVWACQAPPFTADLPPFAVVTPPEEGIVASGRPVQVVVLFDMTSAAADAPLQCYMAFISDVL